MAFKEKLDRFFGIVPSNPLRRITIALISVIFVVVIDILMLLGQSIGFVERIPFLNEQIISIIIVSSLLFSLSLVYYVIYPNKKEKEDIYSYLK